MFKRDVIQLRGFHPRGRLGQIASFQERNDEERLLSGSYVTIVISETMICPVPQEPFTLTDISLLFPFLFIVPSINFFNKLNYQSVGDIANWEVAINNDHPSR